MGWFKKLFKKKTPETVIPQNREENQEVKVLKTYVYNRVDGTFTFNLGDKVICRSNECDPLLIGEIVEFWDNDGKWSTCIPQVKGENGEIYGVMGIMRHYSEELMEELEPLRPLEQWNYFIPDEKYHFDKESIERKEKEYEIRNKSLVS